MSDYYEPIEETEQFLRRTREDGPPIPVPGAPRAPAKPDTPATPDPAAGTLLSAEVERALAGQHAPALESFAGFLNDLTRRRTDIIYHLDQGDLTVDIGFYDLTDDVLTLWERRDGPSRFRPRIGSVVGITCGARRVTAEFVANISAVPPGFPFDLLLFVVQDSPVEKNGKLKDGAPSVVSDRPSDDVDEQGEPVVEGEKAASWTDFDRPRDPKYEKHQSDE